MFVIVVPVFSMKMLTVLTAGGDGSSSGFQSSLERIEAEGETGRDRIRTASIGFVSGYFLYLQMLISQSVVVTYIDIRRLAKLKSLLQQVKKLLQLDTSKISFI